MYRVVHVSCEERCADLPASESSLMKPIYKRAAWGVGILGVVLLLAIPKLRSSDAEAPPGGGRGPGGGGPASVTVEVVSPRPLTDGVSTTGTLLPNEEVELVGETTGRITQVAFQEGSQVRAGQLLVKVNDAELRARRQSIQQRLQLAETNAKRYGALLAGGGISREEYDGIRNQVGVLRAELDQVNAQIAQTEIRAPFNGAVGLRSVSVGGYLSPQSPVATLQQTDPIKLDFDVPERLGNRVRIGDQVSFRVEGSEREYRATVYALEPGIDPTTRTLRARARGPNPNGQLLPGSFAQVELILQEIPNALLVPTTALVPSAERTVVYVARGGRAEARPVETGVRTADRIQIVSGLAAGDSVIATGTQGVRPNGPIRVQAPLGETL